MAKTIKTPLTNRTSAKLYVCLCMKAMLDMMKGDDTDEKIVELIIPLLEELHEEEDILA